MNAHPFRVTGLGLFRRCTDHSS